MAENGADGASVFQIRIASTGDTFEVPGHKSILHVLIENGYRVPSSCSDGRCGTCKVRYLSGSPDHRDRVLEAGERADFVTVCVSRATSRELVLDLPAPGAHARPVDPFALDRPIAVVDAGVCVACLTCVRACAFGAARIDAGLTGVGGILGAAVVDVEECTGCGLCAAACPTGAIGMTRFTDGEVAARIDSVFAASADTAAPAHGAAPRIAAFCCPNSLSAVKAYLGGSDASRAIDLEIVEMPCTGRVDNLYLMRAFQDGADGVVVAGCEAGQCLFKVGNLNAEKRVASIRDWLDELGLGADRACMAHLPENGADGFAGAVEAFAAEVRALGPSPVRASGAGPTSSEPSKDARPSEPG